jgi:hypothetical protein
VEITQREKNDFKFSFLSTHFQSFLGEVVQSFVNVGSNTGGWFVGYFDGRFEDSLRNNVSCKKLTLRFYNRISRKKSKPEAVAAGSAEMKTL